MSTLATYYEDTIYHASTNYHDSWLLCFLLAFIRSLFSTITLD